MHADKLFNKDDDCYNQYAFILCARYYAKHFKSIILYEFLNNPMR